MLMLPDRKEARIIWMGYAGFKKPNLRKTLFVADKEDKFFVARFRLPRPQPGIQIFTFAF
jgi:hypothetical protein